MSIVVEDAFAALVDQFKDPFAFVRELVQNALDAGSDTIDVFSSRDGDVLTIGVQDTGDGMDKDIIETKLVRLFASSKDGDATKIGKFGIGFASVFSIRPDAVVVDTARGAERWRVLFSPDGTWRLFPLDEPIEGTCVKVMKRLAPSDDAAALVERARATLKRWCRYAGAEIRFDGVPVREAFDVPAALRVRVPLDAPGDALVVGLRGDEQVWGFYNKGLTLLEGTGPFDGAPPWVSFRVQYGALEHTITRDNVMRDDAFLRVMQMIGKVADEQLIDAALSALEAESPEADAIQRALVEPLRRGALGTTKRQRARIFRDARGGHISVGDVAQAAQKTSLARVDGAGPLADALEADGRLVVRAPAGTGAGALLEALDGPAGLAQADWVAVGGAGEKEQWQAAPLLHTLAALLETAQIAVADVILGRVDDPTGALRDAPFVAAPHPARPIARALATVLPAAAGQAPARRGKKNKPPTVVLNTGSATVIDALALANTDVWLAAFLLLRHMRVDAPFDVGAEGALASAALTRRSGG